MAQSNNWQPVEGSPRTIVEKHPDPFMALRSGYFPALIHRAAFPSDHCTALIDRFYDRGLLYRPKPSEEGSTKRVDIGTSLGTHHANPDQFFNHAKDTHRLFSTLFDGYRNPVETIYQALAELLPDKRVLTAREPDGRLYGPAIFRCYHSDVGHHPHYDSVSKRSRLFNFAVSRFDHQFAGVMCFQNSEDSGHSGEALLYNAPINPEVDETLTAGTFHQYAEEHGIARTCVHLDPGDLYFFYTENIHEVPAVVGDTSRVVLAVFIGLSNDDEEVYVWS